METTGPSGFINGIVGMALRHGKIWGITEMGVGRRGLTNHSPSTGLTSILGANIPIIFGIISRYRASPWNIPGFAIV